MKDGNGSKQKSTTSTRTKRCPLRLNKPNPTAKKRICCRQLLLRAKLFACSGQGPKPAQRKPPFPEEERKPPLCRCPPRDTSIVGSHLSKLSFCMRSRPFASTSGWPGFDTLRCVRGKSTRGGSNGCLRLKVTSRSYTRPSQLVPLPPGTLRVHLKILPSSVRTLAVCGRVCVAFVRRGGGRGLSIFWQKQINAVIDGLLHVGARWMKAPPSREPGLRAVSKAEDAKPLGNSQCFYFLSSHDTTNVERSQPVHGH